MLAESVASFNVPDELVEDFNNILYVDDEVSNLRVFDSVFSRYYNVYTANSGSMGIKLLREHDIHMIITDQKMPEMTGTDMLEQTLEEFPDVIRIILTGFADIQAIIKAINKCSIYKYVTKPYENTEMKEIIDKGLEIFNMRKKKYDSPINGSASQGTSSKELADELAVGNHFLPLLVSDSLPSKTEFSSVFDHYVLYAKQHEGYRTIYYDSYLYEDEETAKLYFMTLRAVPDPSGAVVYMHMKNRLRKLVEGESIDRDLIDLMDNLEELYIQHNLNVQPFEFQLLSYDWNTKQLDYLTKENRLRIYEVEEQLMLTDAQQIKNDVSGYKYYRHVSDKDLMIYFYDVVPANNGNLNDISSNIGQIVSHGAASPFDLQNQQMGAGLRSIQGDVKDMVFFGLYLNE